jgi:hypothetical protein
MVGKFDQSAPWADKYNDMIGEGVLAFLEGRDPTEAIDRMRKNYDTQEYRQVYFSSLEQKVDDPRNWERLLPIHYDAPMAYEEPPVVSSNVSIPIGLEIQPRISWKKDKVMSLHAARRKGSRGPNRSHRKFRSKSYGEHGL